MVGEASVHAAGEHTDLADQVEETLTNIETLIQTADEESTQDRAASSARGWLSALTHIRVYSVRASDQPAVAALLRRERLPAGVCEEAVGSSRQVQDMESDRRRPTRRSGPRLGGGQGGEEPFQLLPHLQEGMGRRLQYRRDVGERPSQPDLRRAHR